MDYYDLLLQRQNVNICSNIIEFQQAFFFLSATQKQQQI